MKQFGITMTASLVLTAMIASSALAKPRVMNDAEMDKVSGGTTEPVSLVKDTASATATVSPAQTLITDTSTQSIHVGDQAQQNLTSLVNILAINSAIQVMLNVNVSINSTVGSVNQYNNGSQSNQP